jgi:hypothetical protein
MKLLILIIATTLLTGCYTKAYVRAVQEEREKATERSAK